MEHSPSLRYYQDRVDEWIRTYGGGYFSELGMLAQLVEEVGEVARLLSRQYGQQTAKDGDQPQRLGDELADVLFSLICMANGTGIDLSTELERNLAKKTARDATRYQVQVTEPT
jgi:NTP pyrophosphatase (non-canonical NTP hydrolase)